jgi:hypothetical protein
MSPPFENSEPARFSVPWVRNRTAFVWLFAIMAYLIGLPDLAYPIDPPDDGK